MVHLIIHEGDYLLVKPFLNGKEPRQRQLIVTKYLLPADVEEAQARPDAYYDLFEGPTIKYYHYIAGNIYPHRLTSHLKLNETFKIYAADINHYC